MSVNNVFNDYYLKVNPQEFNGKYGCSVLFDNGTSKNELKYKLTIQFTGDIESFIYSYRIEREEKIFINNAEPNNFMDELAFEVSKVLYPMDVSTSNQGKLQKILNHNEILDRWNKKKEKIKEFFKGDIVDKYINQTEQIIKNEEALFSKVQKDWFLNVYFDSLYKFYSEDLCIDESKYYYVANTSPSPIKYKAKSKIEINEKDIRIKTKGTIHDERCARDIEHGFDSPYYKKFNKKEKALKGSCNLAYLLEKETAIIEGIEAEFETKFEQPKKVQIKMFLLEKLTTKRNSMLVEKEEKTSQTGFWGKLFKK